jgi:hypothetical protein
LRDLKARISSLVAVEPEAQEYIQKEEKLKGMDVMPYCSTKRIIDV